jgi:cytoskeletal protein CcmA (bactofilin family)
MKDARSEKENRDMAEQTNKTVIENGTEIDGTIKSDRPIVLSGSLKGRIAAPSLEVMPGGTVQGTIKVTRFSCKGEVGGEVVAETVELAGRVCDATVIRAKTLDVKLAEQADGMQVSFGVCELHVGEKPATAKAKPAASTQESSKSVGSVHNVPSEVVDAVSDLMK